MNHQTIIEVLDKLVGPTEAIGNIYTDRVIEKNLKTLIDVTNWCLDGVKRSYDSGKAQRFIGDRAFEAMIEWSDWLNEQIGVVEYDTISIDRMSGKHKVVERV